MECCKKGVCEQGGNGCGPCENSMGMLYGMNRCGEHYGHTLLRWFLGLVIILLAFLLGVKIGEYKQVYEGGQGGYGWHGRMMGDYGYRNMMYFNGPAPLSEAPAKPVTK